VLAFLAKPFSVHRRDVQWRKQTQESAETEKQSDPATKKMSLREKTHPQSSSAAAGQSHNKKATRRR
jgi:hypothetical protein